MYQIYISLRVFNKDDHSLVKNEISFNRSGGSYTLTMIFYVFSNTAYIKFIPYSDVKLGKYAEEGWCTSAYAVSKVGLSALSIIQQRMFDKESSNRDIAINHVHPGYISTDMTGHTGPLTIEQGAKSSLYCALEADFKGGY